MRGGEGDNCQKLKKRGGNINIMDKNRQILPIPYDIHHTTLILKNEWLKSIEIQIFIVIALIWNKKIH